jgi:hypothetical protein
MDPYATSDLLRKLSAVKLSGGLGSWESARLRANRAERGRRVRNRVIPERDWTCQALPPHGWLIFFFRSPPFLGSAGCGVGVQDRPGRADRVSGRRSLTPTPSSGASL